MCVRTCVCVDTCACMYTLFVCIYVGIYTHVYTYVCECTYIQTCVCICIYTCVSTSKDHSDRGVVTSPPSKKVVLERTSLSISGWDSVSRCRLQEKIGLVVKIETDLKPVSLPYVRRNERPSSTFGLWRWTGRILFHLTRITSFHGRKLRYHSCVCGETAKKGKMVPNVVYYPRSNTRITVVTL